MPEHDLAICLLYAAGGYLTDTVRAVLEHASDPVIARRLRGGTG
jgi:hypothetical protein